ncbi:unnamed protein product, partial [Amoebophrya sp. A25]
RALCKGGNLSKAMRRGEDLLASTPSMADNNEHYRDRQASLASLFLPDLWRGALSEHHGSPALASSA